MPRDRRTRSMRSVRCDLCRILFYPCIEGQLFCTACTKKNDWLYNILMTDEEMSCIICEGDDTNEDLGVGLTMRQAGSEPNAQFFTAFWDEYLNEIVYEEE